jgi:hypothetical protein
MRINRNALIEMGRAHSAAEARLDVEGTLATMEAPYFYEVWPPGLRMEGLEQARRYYTYHFETLRPRIIGMDRIGDWEGDDGIVIERYVNVRADDGRVEKFRVIAVQAFGSKRIAGERMYADERFLRMVFGPMLDSDFKPVKP